MITIVFLFTLHACLSGSIIYYLMNLAIQIIAYNRIESLKRVLSSISSAYFDQNVTLIISIDKSDTNVVENYADEYEWKYGNKIVIKHSENLGLRKHVLECGDRVNDYDGMIVLEDDITVSESFFIYAKQCIGKFKDNLDVAGISLYGFPLNYQNLLPFMPLKSDSDVYLMKCAQSWGQVWMPKQWNEFREWYKNNSEEFCEKTYLPHAICRWPQSSWLKYHTRYCIENNKYFVYPYVSLSTNNGDAGTHVNKRDSSFQANLLFGVKRDFVLNPTIKYDGFFENEMLMSYLGYEDVCIDFYGEKQNRTKNRYWLTRKKMNYKILCSYALECKPYEYNIINNNLGSDLFLYDTSEFFKNKFNMNFGYFLKYIYNIYSFKKILSFFKCSFF